MEAIHNQAFNVGLNAENYQVGDLAAIVQQDFPGCRVTYDENGGPDPRSYRVDFSKITQRVPEFKPAWNARRGVEELHKAYIGIGLTQEEFTGPKYVRIAQLKALIQEGPPGRKSVLEGSGNRSTRSSLLWRRPWNKAFWQNRPILVTGASGHVGGWLVKRLLALQADVICLVRDWTPQCQLVSEGFIQQVKVVQGELSNIDLLRRTLGEYEINTVIHLAAQSIVGTANRDPISTFESNIRGTWCLLEACRLSPSVKQVVVASTDKVYGESEQLPYVEDMPLLAVYPHDVSKACAEMIASSYARTYGLNLAITRLPNIYGGADLNWTRIIPGTIRSIIRNEQPVINSNGKFIRDYLYVEDAAAAHPAAG